MAATQEVQVAGWRSWSRVAIHEPHQGRSRPTAPRGGPERRALAGAARPHVSVIWSCSRRVRYQYTVCQVESPLATAATNSRYAPRPYDTHSAVYAPIPVRATGPDNQTACLGVVERDRGACTTRLGGQWRLSATDIRVASVSRWPASVMLVATMYDRSPTIQTSPRHPLVPRIWAVVPSIGTCPSICTPELSRADAGTTRPAHCVTVR